MAALRGLDFDPGQRWLCYYPDMTSKPATLAEMLRAAIMASPESMHSIAKATQIDQTALTKFARGDRDMNLAAADRLRRHLGLVLMSPMPKTRKKH